MRIARAAMAAGFILSAHAQPFLLRPLHITPGGVIADDSGAPVVLRGLNRSGTGSGNADAASTDADYAAQNRLLSMNVVRIFINAAWWNNNVQVPIANLTYQAYIDQIVQRAKKFGNYVLALKAGQFPDPPCGADAKNCPLANQGDLNCQANASLCAAQDSTGNNIDAAFAFWSTFAKKYASDPAVLYDTWEDMHGIDNDTWVNNQNQLIAAIRSYNPGALIFVEDTGTAFEAITGGTLPDFAWSNIAWNFHIYNASAPGCQEPASPRYANWPQNIAALVAFAQQSGHAVAFTEWGGCNDVEPYHTNITSFALTHSVALMYFEAGNLISQTGGNYQLTVTGAKVAQAYTALASAFAGPAPAVTLVANAEGETPQIAPNTWVEIKGRNLAPVGDSRIWQTPDFVGGRMPTQLDGVSVTVNEKSAYVYYISPTQVNILTPPDAILGPVAVKVTNAGLGSAPMSTAAQLLAPTFFIFGAGPYVAAVHTNGDLVGPASLSVPGYTFTPVKPGETFLLYANGFGPTSVPLISGAITQGGTLSPLPVVTIGGLNATVQFAGLVFPGEFQFNVTVPSNAPDGDLPIVATYGGSKTQAGTSITVQH